MTKTKMRLESYKSTAPSSREHACNFLSLNPCGPNAPMTVQDEWMKINARQCNTTAGAEFYRGLCNSLRGLLMKIHELARILLLQAQV